MKKILIIGISLIVIILLAIFIEITIHPFSGYIEKKKIEGPLERDSIRQTDILALKSAIEQSYGDKGEYPTDLNYLVKNNFLTQIPHDPNGGDYEYEVSDSTYGKNQCYVLKTSFESPSNFYKETSDSGSDSTKWEIGYICGELRDKDFYWY